MRFPSSWKMARPCNWLHYWVTSLAIYRPPPFLKYLVLYTKHISLGRALLDGTSLIIVTWYASFILLHIMFLMRQSASLFRRHNFKITITKAILQSKSPRILWIPQTASRLSSHITRERPSPCARIWSHYWRNSLSACSMQPYFHVDPIVTPSYPSLIIIIKIFAYHRSSFYYSTTILVMPVSSGVRRSLRPLSTHPGRKSSNLLHHMWCLIMCSLLDVQVEFMHTWSTRDWSSISYGTLLRPFTPWWLHLHTSIYLQCT